MAGPILSAVGSQFLQAGVDSVINSVFGKKGPGFQAQLNDQRRAARELIPEQIHADTGARMEVAKKYGISPLTMLGVPTTSMSTNFVGSGATPPFSSGGQDISRAMNAGQTTMEKLQERLLLSQIRGSELDNDMKASALSRSVAPPGTASLGMGQGLEYSKTDSRYLPQGALPLGIGDEAPFLRRAVDEAGDTIRVYNSQDLGDDETMQVMSALGYSVPDWIYQKLSTLLGNRYYHHRETGRSGQIRWKNVFPRDEGEWNFR